MNLHPRNNFRRQSHYRLPRSFFLILICALILIGMNALSSGAISRALHAAAAPLWKGETGVSRSLAVFSELLRTKQALIEENDALRQEIASLQLAKVTAGVVALENEELRKVLNRGPGSGQVVGAVIARPNRSLYDTFVIDIGSQHGVSKGARVFVENRVLVGDVAEVHTRTAIVSLYSSPGRVTDVLVGPDEVPAEAVGRGGGNFEIQLPRGVALSRNDAIIAPALGGGVFGVIGDLSVNSTDPFQTVLFRSPINIQSVRMVTIDL